MFDETPDRPRPNDAVGRLVDRARGLLEAGWIPSITQHGPRWIRRDGNRADEQMLTPADGIALDGLAIQAADEGHGFPHRHIHGGQPYHHRHRGGHRRHRHTPEEPA